MGHLPIARLLGRGDALEIAAADLAFTVEEGCRFLADDVAAGRLSVDDANEIVQRVDDWPAGLQLACLAARAGRSASEVVDAANGASDGVARDLAGEVLDAQRLEHREFLITTTVLDELTAPADRWVITAPGRCGGGSVSASWSPLADRPEDDERNDH